MTLHWWMHWFWVTLLCQHLCGGGILAAPQSEELQLITTDPKLETPPQPPRPSERQSRAMYFTKTYNRTIENNTKINITTARPELNETKQSITPPPPTVSLEESTEIQTELPLPTTIEDIKNITDKPVIEETTQTVLRKKNLTKNTEIHDSEGAAESRIVTEKPLSLETDFLQTRIPPSIEPSRRLTEVRGNVDPGVVTAICFAVLVTVALVGSVSFVVYRRRYLNKPQTLNDKCSNPDSSGYLDDSTIRDNSEEMYSLDNDSFLNSLEAMTIQNYWTDTVKHTKL